MSVHTPGQLFPLGIFSERKHPTSGTWLDVSFADGTSLGILPEAKAKALINAVNCHADLLAALQAIVALDDGDKPDLWHFEKEFANARAAIARATN